MTTLRVLDVTERVAVHICVFCPRDEVEGGHDVDNSESEGETR